MKQSSILYYSCMIEKHHAISLTRPRKNNKVQPTSGRNDQSKILGVNTIHEFPAELRKDGHDQRLPSSASLLYKLYLSTSLLVCF